ncbi:MAG: hypothetical protein ACREFI_15910, partial [Stellaceae bacterium]
MSDDVVPYAGLRLRGEKLSIGSPSPASADVSVRDLAAACREAIGTATIVTARVVPGLLPAVSFCGVIALWVAPARLLSRYPPGQLLDA